MSLEDWRRERFAGKPPRRQTIVGWLESGQLPGKKIGARWFVEVERELNETGDDLVDQVLKAG